MKKFLWGVLAALCAAPGSAAPAADAGDIRQPVILGNPVLKVHGAVDGQSAELLPGRSLPYRVGSSCYDWTLAFDPVAADVEIDEVLILPAPAPHWGSGGNTFVARDRKSARTHLVVDGRSGSASRGWCIAEGDPEGEYQYVLFSGGRIVGWVRFRIGGKVA